MNNKINTLWAVLGSIAIILVFRVVGWIDNSWFGLGMVGAVFGVVLLQKIPETKLTIFTKVYLAWIIWVAILPMAQSSLAGSAPIIAQAMGDRRVYEDLRGGELTRPQMLKALLGYSRAINGIDDSVGLKIAARCAELQARGSQMSLSDLEQETDQIGQEINSYKEWRSKAGKPILEFPKPANFLQGTPPRRMFWSLGLMLAVAGVLLPATGYSKAAKAIWGLAAFFAVLFVFDRIIWGGIVSLSDVQNASAKTLYFAIGLGVIAVIALGHIFKRGALGWAVGILIVLLFVGYVGYQAIWGSGTIGNPPSSSVSSSRSLSPIVVDVAPDKLTSVSLPPGVKCKFKSPGDLTFVFPDGTSKIVRNGEKIDLGPIPSSTFSIRGTAGKVVFTPTQ